MAERKLSPGQVAHVRAATVLVDVSEDEYGDLVYQPAAPYGDWPVEVTD